MKPQNARRCGRLHRIARIVFLAENIEPVEQAAPAFRDQEIEHQQRQSDRERILVLFAENLENRLGELLFLHLADLLHDLIQPQTAVRRADIPAAGGEGYLLEGLFV